MPMARKSKAKPGEVITIDASDVREFRKTNEAIGLRVVEGNLSLLSRKVFNVMMYHAQEMKVPGLNAPINTAAAKKYFWIPLSDLARDAAYDSKDVQYLKKQLAEMQNRNIDTRKKVDELERILQEISERKRARNDR